MKRKALLVGNTNGLPGVQIDLANYANFLKSDFGGAWYESEIIILESPKKQDLFTCIRKLKEEYLDYAFVVYSGHGAYRRETILEINSDEECVQEGDLKNIATRQISIFDCCRNRMLTRLSESRVLYKSFSAGGVIPNYRLYYETRIMQASPQQVTLYACSIGESALDTENGGLYSKNLLQTAIELSDKYVLVGNAHQIARVNTTSQAKALENHVQTPASTIPRVLTEQQLIISLHL